MMQEAQLFDSVHQSNKTFFLVSDNTCQKVSATATNLHAHKLSRCLCVSMTAHVIVQAQTVEPNNASVVLRVGLQLVF